MATAVRRRKLEIRLYHPDWHHGHGSKMMLQASSASRIAITSRVASLTIHKTEGHKSGRDWALEWDINHSNGRSRGWCHFSDADLASAFGLSEESGEFGQHMLDRFGGDVAEQGKYIRWGVFLTIPGPGTSQDGDPNISIDIDDKIKDAVKRLLGK